MRRQSFDAAPHPSRPSCTSVRCRTYGGNSGRNAILARGAKCARNQVPASDESAQFRSGIGHAIAILAGSMKALLALFVATLVTGCVPTMQADALLNEVRNNQIAALDAYEGKKIRVTGTIEATGLKNVNETITEGSVTGANVGDIFVGGTESTSRTETRQVPFVSLKSDGGTAGNVVCFFSDDNRSVAAKLRADQMTTVQGTVYRVKGSAKYAIVQMNDCDVIR